MARRELLPYLQDIVERIERVDKMIAEIGTYSKLISSNIYMDALARNFEIIGEALFQSVKLNPDLNVADRNAIIGLRHIIVQDYYELEYDRLWIIATRNLSLLKEEINELIASESKRLFGDEEPDIL